MKRLLLVFSVLLLFVGLYAQQTIKVYNKTAIERNEVVKIPLSVKNRNKDLSAFCNGKLVESQMIDDNGDGSFDNLAIFVNIKPHEALTLKIKSDIKHIENKEKLLANVYMSYNKKNNKNGNVRIDSISRKRGLVQDISNPIFHMEGPGIENDKIAFRSFFDYRNGKDIYGKITSKPVLDIVGVESSWHKMSWWGKDILHVGSSLSAGGIAVLSSDGIKNAGDADKSTYKALNRGALFASYKLMFEGWDGGLNKVDGSEKISICKGDYYYKNEINRPLSELEKLVIGISNFGISNVKLTKHNDKFISLSTYGLQADENDKPLGLAIMFETSQYVSYNTNGEKDVPNNTSYVVLNANPQTRVVYFFSCWGETDKKFNDESVFANYLQTTADMLANPLIIKIVK